MVQPKPNFMLYIPIFRNMSHRLQTCRITLPIFYILDDVKIEFHPECAVFFLVLAIQI